MKTENKPKRIDQTILRGDRVRYAHAFLDGTGQFDAHQRGPAPPCHWGHHARGTVTVRENRSRMCTVKWDDGKEARVLVAFLKRDDGEYPTTADVQARGWPEWEYVQAMRQKDEDAITVLHPSNWMTEAEVEDPRFDEWYEDFRRTWGF